MCAFHDHGRVLPSYLPRTDPTRLAAARDRIARERLRRQASRLQDEPAGRANRPEIVPNEFARSKSKEFTMIVMMPESRVKSVAKRLRKVLTAKGIDIKHVRCLDIAARLNGFDDWKHYCGRDRSEPLAAFDHKLSEDDFSARDAFQIGVLEAEGLGALARDVLDRVDPTGIWSTTALAPANGPRPLGMFVFEAGPWTAHS
jgi:hypothetical protein